MSEQVTVGVDILAYVGCTHVPAAPVGVVDNFSLAIRANLKGNARHHSKSFYAEHVQ